MEGFIAFSGYFALLIIGYAIYDHYKGRTDRKELLKTVIFAPFAILAIILVMLLIQGAGFIVAILIPISLLIIGWDFIKKLIKRGD